MQDHVELRPARPNEIAAFYAGEKTDYDVLMVEGAAVAMVSRVWMPDGRRWGFLDTKPGASRLSVRLVRAIRRRLVSVEETVWVACQEDRFPSAPKLLRVVGFRPTDEFNGRWRVWVWRR